MYFVFFFWFISWQVWVNRLCNFYLIFIFNCCNVIDEFVIGINVSAPPFSCLFSLLIYCCITYLAAKNTRWTELDLAFHIVSEGQESDSRLFGGSSSSGDDLTRAAVSTHLWWLICVGAAQNMASSEKIRRGRQISQTQGGNHYPFHSLFSEKTCWYVCLILQVTQTNPGTLLRGGLYKVWLPRDRDHSGWTGFPCKTIYLFG